MQTLFLKYFPLIIIGHFVLCVFTFAIVFAYADKMLMNQMDWTAWEPLLVKSAVVALINQTLPVYLYFKWSRES